MEQWARQGLLKYHASRPTVYGLEMHLVSIHKMVKDFAPDVIVLDPVTNLTAMGTTSEVNSMLVRLIDFLKTEGITALFTGLTSAALSSLEATEVGISSLIDTWLVVRDIETNGERNRGLYIIKSRGMAHSNQIREFILTSQGLDLREVYVGSAGLLTGASRVAMEARERAQALAAEQEIEAMQIRLERKRKAMEAQWAAMQAEYETEQEEAARIIRQKQSARELLQKDKQDMSRVRQADDFIGSAANGRKET
jgi:circadian clock protein KaiC